MSRNLRTADEGNEIVGGNFTESAAELVHVSLAHAVEGLLADAINDYGGADVDGTSAPSSPTGLDVKSMSSVSVPTSDMTPKQSLSRPFVKKGLCLLKGYSTISKKTSRINSRSALSTCAHT